MRIGMGLGGIVLGFGLAGTIWAQNSDPSSFLTGVSPQNLVNQQIDVSQSLIPTAQTTEGFSFRRFLGKVIPGFAATPNLGQFSPKAIAGFMSPPNISSFSPLAIFGTKEKTPTKLPLPLPAPTTTAPMQPLMPLYKPTTVLPTFNYNSPIQPVLPPASLPPFKLTGPIRPIPPFVPNN
jgi:hypothetical protein